MRRFALVFVLLCAVANPLEAAAAEGQQEPTDATRMQQSLAMVRDVGIAAFAWLTDKVGDDPNLEPGRSVASEDGAVIDWTQCPAISHAELVELLVPTRIQAVPAVDPWGNPLEFCLNQSNLLRASYVIGVRSAGRDGKFNSNSYERSTFEATNFDHDIVWLDGFLIASPKQAVQ